jgi:hypothetical protein
MPLDPIALSASTARMVVAAASTDPSPASQTAKQRLPKLLSGDPEQQLLAELQLDYARDQLRATAGLDREQARAALEAGWRAELDPLAQDPETARELQALVERLRQELHNGMVDAGKKARTRKHWRAALRPIPGVLDWYKVNAFAGILLAAGFVVLKCYVVARGDITTALGILQYVVTRASPTLRPSPNTTCP